jgi:hypothetical protein
MLSTDAGNTYVIVNAEMPVTSSLQTEQDQTGQLEAMLHDFTG